MKAEGHVDFESSAKATQNKVFEQTRRTVRLSAFEVLCGASARTDPLGSIHNIKSCLAGVEAKMLADCLE